METVDEAGWVTVLVTVVVLGMSDVKTPEAISIKETIQEDEDVLVGAALGHGDQLGGCDDICLRLSDRLSGLEDGRWHQSFDRHRDGEDGRACGLSDSREDGGCARLEDGSGDNPAGDSRRDHVGLC